MNIETICTLRENFRLRNIEVAYFDTLEEVKEYILDKVPAECTIGIGHSGTLQKLHVTSALLERGNVVYDKELTKDKEESKRIKKKALLTDWYITGSNAVSVDGRIVNVDHSGNRVAAITFGPDKVIIVVGRNKVVPSLADAIARVKNVACPINAKRAGFNPPCVALGRCVDCVSGERVYNSLSIIEGQSEPDRMILCIADEDCGF